MKLYKYYSVNKYSISTLVNNFCWFSDPETFNDPFDSNIVPIQTIKNAQLSGAKFLCLSSQNDNLLMWSHYSDSHRGFCVEFTDFTDEEIKNGAYGEYDPTIPMEHLCIIRSARPIVYKTSEEIDNLVSEIPQLKKDWTNNGPIICPIFFQLRNFTN